MRTHFTDRYDYPRPPHETYISAEVATKQTRLFATIFRHPIFRAISLYHYIQQASSIVALTRNLDVHRVIWLRAHNANMTLGGWIEEPQVIQLLQRNYFHVPTNKSYRELKHLMSLGPSAASELKSNAKERTKKKVVVGGNSHREKQFKDRIAAAVPDPAYHCASQMETVMLLTQRYSAVGQLEDVGLFWRILSARARLKMTPADIAKAVGTHINKSIKSSMRGQDKAYERLRDLLFCDIVLWDIAGLIAKKDLECPEVQSAERPRNATRS
jgi:hypothetical protein